MSPQIEKHQIWGEKGESLRWMAGQFILIDLLPVPEERISRSPFPVSWKEEAIYRVGGEPADPLRNVVFRAMCRAPALPASVCTQLVSGRTWKALLLCRPDLFSPKLNRLEI